MDYPFIMPPYCVRTTTKKSARFVMSCRFTYFYSKWEPIANRYIVPNFYIITDIYYKNENNNILTIININIMGRYIKLFENHTQYENYINGSSAILPNVSFCATESDVHYNPYIPPQPEYRNRSGETYCEGYDKYVDVYSEVSYDGGSTWEITATTETLVERNSEDCGYVKDSRLIAIYTTNDWGETVQLFYCSGECVEEHSGGSGSGSGGETGCTNNTPFYSVEVDGNIYYDCDIINEYQFYDKGEHVVKYELKDPSSFGRLTFFNCDSLTSIDIPDSVTSIDEQSFYQCTGLTSCTIGSGVTSIGQLAFYDCTGLTSIDMPDSLRIIDRAAFGGCKFTSIDIPDSVTSIGESAFNNCRSLTSIDIPSGVTSIGSSAFTTYGTLTAITVDSNNTTYDSRNNCNAIIETRTNTLIQGCNNTVIPNSVTSIGDGAFLQYSGLTSIDIPNSVTTIGRDAFYYCSGLTSIDIPDSVTSIGENAFHNCRSLTSCTIGSGVTSIGGSTFYGCSGLTSIVCNATTAPTIQSNTFRNVKTGGILTVPSGSSGYDTWMQNANYYLGLYNWTKVEQ